MRYLQFNDLVLENSRITSDTNNTPFKYNGEEKEFDNGDYSQDKDTRLIQARDISISCEWDLRQINNELKKFIKQYILSRITRDGIIWAIDNDELLWAKAKVINYDVYPISYKYKCEMEVKLVEGIFHKAEPKQTFITDYCLWEYMTSQDFKDIDYCNGCYVSLSSKKCITEECCNERSICGMDVSVFNSCIPPYILAIDTCCFGGYEMSTRAGNNIITENVFVDTDLMTKCDVVLKGKMIDPIVEINNTKLMFNGTYDGELIYHSNGELEYFNKYNLELIKPSKIKVIKGDYFYKIKPGYNRVVINRNTSEDYFKARLIADRITI